MFLDLGKDGSHTQVNLGIIQGGQLGRMLIQSCMDFGITSLVLDKDPHCPCRHFCSQFIEGDPRDFNTVYKFGKKLDVITFEFEDINIEALKRLENEGVIVRPSPKILALVQDKGEQKLYYQRKGIPTADFVLVSSKIEISKHFDFLPGVIKLRRSGYDGRGVQKIKSIHDVDKAFDLPAILEKEIDIEKEIAVIVARNIHGEVVTYPLVEMIFDEEAHQLDMLFSPAQVDESVTNTANEIAVSLAETLGLIGVLAVEMFVTKSGKVLVNEIAPRPHNSGHHTIESNWTSQFEQLLRAILNLPLGSTELLMPAVMVNLVGEKGFRGIATYEGIQEVLKIPGVHLHLYGKKETRFMRKMGHITVLDNDLNRAKQKAILVKQKVRVVA